jgi:hypothetical protein
MLRYFARQIRRRQSNSPRHLLHSEALRAVMSRRSRLVVPGEPSVAAVIGQDNPPETGIMMLMREGRGMRVQQSVLFVLALMTGGMAAHPAVSQDNRGTSEQQMACTPDVWRLCGAQIPDVDRITACLRANVPQLSPPCRAVFETASANTQSEPRPRARHPTQPQQPYPTYQDDDE